ncbi:HAMP domain-containing histidine kinase [Neobacillus cucumis]|uniref:sensor histidine kinase n=1 Tax=Neobacillus cucumis TaxID=1740721 RepID=UPI0018DFE61B|nr:HAMP domain-containing sensor histidine kinase [Neobacillus cucumis]MBI0578744.1 HAMP domain-containing histidine kinase [Neobacillus cucumis]
MGIKWKNKLLIGIWVLLITFGLSGIITVFTSGERLLTRNYFHTQEFQSYMDQFPGYFIMFELTNIPLEEAKKTIKVTKDDINEYRYRYGSLSEQENNIKEQYEQRIFEAKAKEDQVTVDSLTAERDQKIKDITNTFNSDMYVEQKIVKEKEKKIEKYFKEKENYREEFQRYKDAFLYYYQDKSTGKVYTNLQLSDGKTAKDVMNSKHMLFYTNHYLQQDDFMYFGPGDHDVINAMISKSMETSGVQLGVPKSLSSDNWLMSEAENYKKQRNLLWIYVVSGMIALLVGFLIRKNSKGIPAEIEKWKRYYNWLPIDVRGILFILSGLGFAFGLFAANNQVIYFYENPFVTGKDFVIFLFIGLIFGAITFIQWNYLYVIKKDWKTIKTQWEKALVFKSGKNTKFLFQKAVVKLKEAFLNQTAATQLFILLGAAYSLGLVAVLVVVQPVFLPFYLILIGLAAIPIVIMLVNRMAYLNKIVEKTNELAAGKMGQDLEVSGKSVFAKLAGNINVLKQGVKTSQNAQAKSERLKTELITNVSHDLRTPLTSIITYTQLLKTDEVSTEERTAYLEIIDRKSKRLKVLIDDLFEVSKMASGNIELKKEKVDLVQLLQQALGEYDVMINESSLQFRVTNTEKPINAIVDGQKLWRVFDNLIGNILKYSMENSRVYITISKLNGQAMITFKNVSKYELNDNSDELFERFKRGDTSRHTDGSGLGLAIAKSIIDLHEGSLEIETDGDLFKVSISLWISE